MSESLQKYNTCVAIYMYLYAGTCTNANYCHCNGTMRLPTSVYILDHNIIVTIVVRTTRLLVGHCLATEVFIGKLPAT